MKNLTLLTDESWWSIAGCFSVLDVRWRNPFIDLAFISCTSILNVSIILLNWCLVIYVAGTHGTLDVSETD